MKDTFDSNSIPMQPWRGIDEKDSAGHLMFLAKLSEKHRYNFLISGFVTRNVIRGWPASWLEIDFLHPRMDGYTMAIDIYYLKYQNGIRK